MKVIDLTDEHRQLYFVCLEDWSEEMKEAGNHKEIWYNEMKDKCLRVKLAIDKHEPVGGMIEYMPLPKVQTFILSTVSGNAVFEE